MTSPLIEELLQLRNNVHKGDFRYNFTPNLWSSHYLSEKEIRDGRLVQIREKGELEGYAVLEYSTHELNITCIVREMCASSREVFQQVVDRVIEEALKQNVDFIAWRKCQESFDDLLKEKGFLTLAESIIMIALLNPKEFLKPLSSKEVGYGKIARLNIKGFESLFVKIGKNSFSITENCHEDFTISTDGLTLVKLFFGRASFFKEWLKGRIIVSVFNLRGAKRLFLLIKNERWHIPSGDWC